MGRPCPDRCPPARTPPERTRAPADLGHTIAFAQTNFRSSTNGPSHNPPPPIAKRTRQPPRIGRDQMAPDHARTRAIPNTLPPSLRSGSGPAAAPGPPSRRLPQDRYRPVNAALDTEARTWRHARSMVLPKHPARPMATQTPGDQTNPRTRHSIRTSLCRRLAMPHKRIHRFGTNEPSRRLHATEPPALASLGHPARRGTWSTIPTITRIPLPPCQRRP